MELDHLRNRLHAMKCPVENEGYITHMLSNLTNEYSELVAVLESDPPNGITEYFRHNITMHSSM